MVVRTFLERLDECIVDAQRHVEHWHGVNASIFPQSLPLPLALALEDPALRIFRSE